MIKNIFTLCVLFISTISIGQNTIDKEVGEFNEIKAYDLLEVNMIRSNENRILIKGRNADDIEWVNKDGTLKLRMTLDKKFTGADTFIEVYYKDIAVIDANEGAKITCNEIIKRNKIELRSQEGARIHIGIDVAHLDVRAVTGGVIEASGLAKNQSIVLNTGGVFHGRDLKTQITYLKIAAGGEATVFATEEVDVNVKVGGDVTVYGQPKTVHEKTFGGGEIRIVD